MRVTRGLKTDTSNASNEHAESAARALERLATRDAEIVALKEVIRACGGAPDDLQCPISHELMRDPVVAADGRTYERAEITGWIGRGHNRSPMTKTSGWLTRTSVRTTSRASVCGSSSTAASRLEPIQIPFFDRNEFPAALTPRAEIMRCAPLRRCAAAPLRRCAAAPLRRTAAPPLRRTAAAPLRRTATQRRSLGLALAGHRGARGGGCPSPQGTDTG